MACQEFQWLGKLFNYLMKKFNCYLGNSFVSNRKTDCYVFLFFCEKNILFLKGPDFGT